MLHLQSLRAQYANLNTPELLPATVHYHLDLSDNPRGNVPADISKYPGSEAREPYTDATAENPAWTSTVPMTTQRPNGQDFSPERLPSTERSGLPAPRSPEASHQTHNPRVSRRNEHSTREQEEVVELREMRLAEGMMLKSKRKELRGIRMKAGDTEGQFMNVLRVFLEQLNIEFPPKISMLYDDVQTTRDRLAGLEDDYNQAESEYDALEWKCSNRESKFYQKFSGDDSICGTSSPAESPENQVSPDGPEAQFSSAVGEVEMLKEQLNELKREYAEQIEEKNRRELYGLPISTQDASFINDFPRLQEELQCEIEAAELIAQQLRDKLKPNEPHQGSRRASDPHIPTAIKVSTVQHVTNIPQSESALASLAQQFTDKRKFINDWILDSLKYSPLEKARLKAQLGMTDLDDDTWWKLVVQHWNQDEIENPFAGKVSSPSASRVTAKAMNPSASASMHSPRAGHHAILAESTSNQIIPVRDDAGLVLPPDTKPTPKSQYSPIEDLIISVSSSFPEKVPEAQKGISLQSPGLPSAPEAITIPRTKEVTLAAFLYTLHDH
ncbi:hypothetical protein AOQ84DRAFT_223384 [Glonium stellatum]|uniref:Uncharacterized protein n=1 Tax=Glonium stellatum TaxID=574774 RepID=A0A8E2JRJ1_9PEZI|nr:hypothetical protein AOQ84DRAFT_223384 [Glonium stellatum]